MLINNTRQLHLMLGKGAMTALAQLNAHQLKKKYPGEHIALVRPEDKNMAEESGIFSEVHSIDLSYIQRSSFSPLLGDEQAFGTFYRSLAPLKEQKWSRIFNTKGRSIDTALTEIFQAENIVGAFALDNNKSCKEAPLKLLSLIDMWGMGHFTLETWLVAKTFGQLDWTTTEVCLQKIIEIKNQKNVNALKTIIVGLDLTSARELAPEKLALLEHLFTVVDTSNEDCAMNLFVDLFITTDNSPQKNFWNYSISLESADPDYLSEILGEAIPKNLNKWSSLAFLFDYLGNPRAALASEKIMARYDREALQQFLLNQVMNLKSFARILLDGLRKQSSDNKNILESYWPNNPGIISFVSAVELSLHQSITPLLRNDQDVLSIKGRMRSLNQFYERLHRATALEVPKTDLGLTL